MRNQWLCRPYPLACNAITSRGAGLGVVEGEGVDKVEMIGDDNELLSERSRLKELTKAASGSKRILHLQ
jgi:hypothetical protein